MALYYDLPVYCDTYRFILTIIEPTGHVDAISTKGASDQFMNQHLLVKIRQLCVANLGNSLAITCDWRLDLAHFPYAAE